MLSETDDLNALNLPRLLRLPCGMRSLFLWGRFGKSYWGEIFTPPVEACQVKFM